MATVLWTHSPHEKNWLMGSCKRIGIGPHEKPRAILPYFREFPNLDSPYKTLNRCALVKENSTNFEKELILILILIF